MVDQSSKWTLVAEIPLTFETDVLLEELNAQQIAYRLDRIDQYSELWVEHSEHVPRVFQILEQINHQHQKAYQQSQPGFLEQLKKMPVVATLILLSVFGALLVEWAFPLVHWFTFQDFTIVGESIRFNVATEAMSNGEYWRLLTPIFLHFGLFHVAFNSLWVWELGRRIEPLGGSLHTGIVVLLIGFSSNLGQYLWGGPSLFGGMSGVVYGLLGYVWIRNKVSPRPVLAIPPGLLGFMLFWLVLCMSGVIGFFMSGSIANAAHVVGLLTGIILGGWAGYIESSSR
jgi:GlpG protein